MKPMKPILFNTDMVRANLADRKTNTRRLIKPRYRDDECGFQIITNAHTGEFVRVEKISDQGSGIFPDGSERFVRPPYQPGDILYVRETWGNYSYDDPESNATYFMYRADFPDDAKGYWYEPEHIHFCDFPRWRPSIHMPKEAARLFLRVTKVRVEQLQDITEEEAMAEGIWQVKTWPDIGRFTYKANHAMGRVWSTARDCFRWGLWNSTIKKGDLDTYGWDANPWVWVIKYERISKEEAMKC